MKRKREVEMIITLFQNLKQRDPLCTSRPIYYQDIKESHLSNNNFFIKHNHHNTLRDNSVIIGTSLYEVQNVKK